MGDDDGMLLNLAGMDAGPPRAQKKRTGPSNNNGRNGRRPSGSDGGQLQQQQQPARQKQRPQAGDDGEGAGGRDHRRSSGGGTGGGGGGGGGGRAQWDGDDDDFDGFDGAGGRRQPEQKRRAPRLVVEDSSTLPALKAPKVSAAGRAGLFGHGAGSADAATAAAAAAAAAAASNAVPGSFESLGVPEKLAEHLRANMALEWPTRVQALTIPVMLSGRDALVRSETGSGKTLAYLLPIACSLSAAEPRVTRADGTLALVLSPTRELCLQTLDVASKLVRPVIWLVPGAVMGGESRQKEKSRIRKGITILCATPGRLVDHVRSTQSFRLASVRFVVFDEADRLLDMGFEEHITEILQHLKSAAAEAGESGRRCTALLSATLPPTLARLTEVALKDPVRIVASRDGQVAAGNTVPRSTRWAAENDEDKDGDGDGDSDGDGDGDTGGRGGRAGPSGGEDAEPEGFAFPQQLRQEFLVVPCKARAAVLLAALRDLLRKGTQRVLCFFSTCESSEFHFRLFSVLLLEGQPALPCDLHRLHGDLTQPERQKVFKLFNGGKAGVLFCTDVAARGLDFSAVGACLQVDLAGPGDYCHRVGRTARMGHEGSAMAFVLPSEREYTSHLRALGAPLAQARAGPLLDRLLAQGGRKRGRDGRDGGAGPAGLENADEAARHPVVQAVQGAFQALLRSDEELFGLAEGAFRAHVRAYATHPAALKHIFHVKKLHLGHLAAAFGLEKPPSVMSGEGKKKKKLLLHKGTDAEQKERRERKKAASGPGGKRKTKAAKAATKIELADLGRFDDGDD